MALTLQSIVLEGTRGGRMGVSIGACGWPCTSRDGLVRFTGHEWDLTASRMVGPEFRQPGGQVNEIPSTGQRLLAIA